MDTPLSGIPSAWRAMNILTEALQLLEANPDLVGEDIEIALASEVPEAGLLLDAIVHTIQKREVNEAASKAYATRVTAIATREGAGADKLRSLLCETMQKLKLSRHRAPGGLVTVSDYKGKVHIPDDSKVPSQYKIPQPDKLDMKAIAEAVDADPTIEWATRGNGYQSVKIRG